MGHGGVGWVMQGWGDQKGDIVMDPMNSRVVLPKNVPGVGWGGSCRGSVGWVMVGWGGSWLGGSCRGRVGWVMLRWGGSWLGWVM